jgi:metal-dependent amidase/aminoacylase/carboxypeptidase family protein
VAIRGTLRSYDPGVREQLIEDVRQAFALTRSLGGDFQLEMRPGYPAAFNNPRVSGWVRQVADDILGHGRTDDNQCTMGGEDFAYLAQLAPGAMYRLGVKRPGGTAVHLHAATFDIDEDALPFGTAILTETALRYLSGTWQCGDDK